MLISPSVLILKRNTFLRNLSTIRYTQRFIVNIFLYSSGFQTAYSFRTLIDTYDVIADQKELIKNVSIAPTVSALKIAHS